MSDDVGMGDGAPMGNGAGDDAVTGDDIMMVSEPWPLSSWPISIWPIPTWPTSHSHCSSSKSACEGDVGARPTSGTLAQPECCYHGYASFIMVCTVSMIILAIHLSWLHDKCIYHAVIMVLSCRINP